MVEIDLNCYFSSFVEATDDGCPYLAGPKLLFQIKRSYSRRWLQTEATRKAGLKVFTSDHREPCQIFTHATRPKTAAWLRTQNTPLRIAASPAQTQMMPAVTQLCTVFIYFLYVVISGWSALAHRLMGLYSLAKFEWSFSVAYCPLTCSVALPWVTLTQSLEQMEMPLSDL